VEPRIRNPCHECSRAPGPTHRYAHSARTVRMVRGRVPPLRPPVLVLLVRPFQRPHLTAPRAGWGGLGSPIDSPHPDRDPGPPTTCAYARRDASRPWDTQPRLPLYPWRDDAIRRSPVGSLVGRSPLGSSSSGSARATVRPVAQYRTASPQSGRCVPMCCTRATNAACGREARATGTGGA
jgi:hypothetical protein